METREDKKIGYGVTEDLYEKRESIENNYINSVRDALNDLVEEAKEYPGWETLVISRLNKRFGFKIGNSTLFLIFEFMNHPNIITRSSSNGNNLRLPIIYKYVSAEEKLTLGFDAVYYKKISDTLLNYLKEQIDESYYPDVNSILCVLNYLILCNADKGWVQLPVIQIGARTGMLLKNVMHVINLLIEKHVLCLHYHIKQLSRNRRRSVAVRMATSEEEYEQFLRESEDKNIILYGSKDYIVRSAQIANTKEKLAQNLGIDFRETEKPNFSVDKLSKSDIINAVENESITIAYESTIKELMEEIMSLKNEVVKLKTENKILRVKSQNDV